MRDITFDRSLYSINTATLGFKTDLEKIINMCAKREIGWISPWRSELEKNNINDISNLLKKKKIKVSSLCRSSYYTASTKEARLKAIDDNKKWLHIAEKLNASCYMQVVGSLYAGEKNLALVREQVKEGINSLLETSFNTGVPISIEPLHPMTCGDRLGVTVDVYHTWWDASLFEQVKRAGNRIHAYHVSDWKLNTCDLVNDRGMPGEGCIDLKQIRNQVESCGYTGPVEIEVFSKDFWWKKSTEEILDACISTISKYC